MLKCDGCDKLISEYKTFSSYRGENVKSINVCYECYNELVGKIIEDMSVIEFDNIKNNNNAIEVIEERLKEINGIA